MTHDTLDPALRARINKLTAAIKPVAPCPGTGGDHVPDDYIDGVQKCCHCDVVIDRERPLDRIIGASDSTGDDGGSTT
jgi:hypothetical protein